MSKNMLEWLAIKIVWPIGITAIVLSVTGSYFAAAVAGVGVASAAPLIYKETKKLR